MKKITRALSLFLSLMLTFAMSTQALAASEPVDTPNLLGTSSRSLRWTNIEKFTPILSLSGNTITSGVYVNASSSSAKITGTYTLEKKAESVGPL